MPNRLTFMLLLLLGAATAAAQDTLYLENPSFEDDLPRAGDVPPGWLNRGTPGETPPDIQPGSFNVFFPAQHGLTYVGLVVRDNNTWEALGQPLKKGRLEKGSAYRFSVYLARANQLLSTSRVTDETVNFGMSCVLQVWGADTTSGKRELLAMSAPVAHARWERYDLTLEPVEGSYDEIQLVAYYKANVLNAYNGNLLIDNCSHLVKK